MQYLSEIFRPEVLRDNFIFHFILLIQPTHFGTLRLIKYSMATKNPTPDKGLIYEMDLKNDTEGFEVQFSSKGYSITGTAPWKTCE